MLSCEKDDSDTVFALKEAAKKGFDAFLFLGASGGRRPQAPSDPPA